MDNWHVEENDSNWVDVLANVVSDEVRESNSSTILSQMKGQDLPEELCIALELGPQTGLVDICSEMLRHRSIVKLDARCSGVNPCMSMHGCTADLSTWTR